MEEKMDDNTKKIIADLKKAGLDTSNIEHQLMVNPILDKQVDGVIGNAGILRQADYTRYMNEVKQKELQVQQQAQQLATLHDASKTTELPQQALDTISALEEALIETGMFTPESIKEISFLGKQPLVELTKPPVANPAITQPPPNSNTGKDKEMPFDESKFVDIDSHKSSMANLAYGTIATNLQINAAIDEVKALGIPVTREKVTEFEKNIRAGFETGNSNLDDIVDKTFGVSTVRTQKAKEDLDKQLADAKAAGRAEALKESGVPNSRASRLLGGRHSPVFDRKRATFVDSSKAEGDTSSGFKDDKGNIDISKLPKNSEGDPELFRARNDRDYRVGRAAELHDKIMERAEQDPLYDY